MQITTNLEECGPCLVFANFTLAFALQLRKRHRETSVRVGKTSAGVRETSEYSILITKTPTHYKTYTHTLPHITKPAHTHPHPHQGFCVPNGGEGHTNMLENGNPNFYGD